MIKCQYWSCLQACRVRFRSKAMLGEKYMDHIESLYTVVYLHMLWVSLSHAMTLREDQVRRSQGCSFCDRRFRHSRLGRLSGRSRRHLPRLLTINNFSPVSPRPNNPDSRIETNHLATSPSTSHLSKQYLPHHYYERNSVSDRKAQKWSTPRKPASTTRSRLKT